MSKNLATAHESSVQSGQVYKLLPQSGLPLPKHKSERFWPNLNQLDNAYDISNYTVWSFMDFEGRASYNLGLLEDFHNWHDNIASFKQDMSKHFQFVVLGSRHDDFFCLGGDLDHFSRCIVNKDRKALYDYGYSCVKILHRNWRATERGLITIGLVQGDALGGGFESLLSFDVICAEKGAKFGFPEHLFGLFPGMGALTFLGRKLGFAKAEQLVRTGKTMTAEELYDLGVIHILSEPGEGAKDVRKYISRTSPRHEAAVAFHAAMKRANPIPFSELDEIVQLWAEAAMNISQRELKIMERLVSAQTNKPVQSVS